MRAPAENPHRKAIEVLAERGWTKGTLEDANGVCIIGACLHAYRFFELSPIRDVVEEQYPERVKRPGFSPVAAFNDHPDTTLEDVILVLEKAAARFDEVLA